MKPLYIIQYATNVNPFTEDLIPVKEFKWKDDYRLRVAYEDRDLCNRDRIDIQTRLSYNVVRVHKVGFFKNLWIRLMDTELFGWKWIIIHD